MPDTRKTNKANAPLGNADATPALSAGLERPSMRCMICGLTSYARDAETDKYVESHYDCECGGHSFYPRAMKRAL